MSAIVQVPFYPSDWLAGTRGMTAAQMGVYITLIAMMYEQAGPIRCDDMAKIARLCGTSASSLKGILDCLISDNKIAREGDNLTNRRAMLEIEKVKAKSGAAKANINARWGEKQAKSDSDEYGRNTDVILAISHKPIDISPLISPQVLGGDTQIALPIGSDENPVVAKSATTDDVTNGRELQLIEKPKKSKESKPVEYDWFGDFWDCYPKVPNQSKQKAMQIFAKLSEDDRHDCAMGAYYFSKWLEKQREKRPGDNQFIPHAATFIGQRRWETVENPHAIEQSQQKANNDGYRANSH